MTLPSGQNSAQPTKAYMTRWVNLTSGITWALPIYLLILYCQHDGSKQLNVGPASFNIQEEWKDYIRVALDSLVLRSRDSLSYYIANKRYTTYLLQLFPLARVFADILVLFSRFTVNLTYLLQWGRIQLFGRSNIKLDQVCKHMDATTVWWSHRKSFVLTSNRTTLNE